MEERSGLGGNEDGRRKGKSGTGEQVRTKKKERKRWMFQKENREGTEGRGARVATADSNSDT